MLWPKIQALFFHFQRWVHRLISVNRCYMTEKVLIFNSEFTSDRFLAGSAVAKKAVLIFKKASSSAIDLCEQAVIWPKRLFSYSTASSPGIDLCQQVALWPKRQFSFSTASSAIDHLCQKRAVLVSTASSPAVIISVSKQWCGSSDIISRSKYWSASGPSSSRLPYTHPLLVLTVLYPKQACFKDYPEYAL